MRRILLFLLIALIAIPTAIWTPTASAAARSLTPRAKIDKRDGMLDLSIAVRGNSADYTFEWFQRTLGTTSTAIGTNAKSIEVPPQAGETYYWVRITDPAQNVVDSAETRVNYTPTALIVTKQPQGRVDRRSGLLQLSVSTKGGIAPYSYAWYQGAVGDTSTPVGADDDSISISPTDGYTLYWVRITDNTSTTINSEAVGITYVAQNLRVASQPRAKIDRTSGLLQLTVAVTGGIAPFTYDWYVGTIGDTSSPITSTVTNSVSISPTAGNTSYWVRITDSASTTIDSSDITYSYTVASLVISKSKAKLNKRSGELELEVDVKGGIAPYSYAWYQGALDDTSIPVGSDNDEVTIAAPSGNTTYWVQVTDSASTVVKSDAFTSNFTPTALTIRQIKGKVDDRGFVELEASVRGGAEPYTYAWYSGASGDTSTTVGTDADEVRFQADAGTLNYWVRISDRTGATVDSSTLTLTYTPQALVIDESEIEVKRDGIVALKVEVKGGTYPYTYAWFAGAVDDESTPVGDDNRKIEIPVIPGVVTYWVKVTDAAGDIVKSDVLSDSYTPGVLVIRDLESELNSSGQFVAYVSVDGGVSPYTYAWFAGAVDDESTPVGSDAPFLMVDADPSISSYWVKITDRVGTIVKSDAISTAYTPDALTITKTKAKVDRDGRLELEVDATGGAKPYTYAWFQGAVDDESTPVGNNYDEIKIPADAGNSTYWVKITDRLSNTVKSDAISTSFTPSALTIKKMSRGRTIPLKNGTAKIELEAEARGGSPSYTYAWYSGTTGDTSTLVSSNDEIKITQNTTGSYSYWVRITDRLGQSYDSTTVTFTVIDGGSGGGGSDDEDDD